MPLSPDSAAGLFAASLLVWVSGSSVLRLAGARFADPAIALGLSLGLGVAVQPLVWLWLDTVFVPITSATIVGAAGLLFLTSVVVGRRQQQRRARSRPAFGSELWPGRGQQGAVEVHDRMGPRADRWALAALATTTAAALAGRWWAARDLDLPRWGDSVHHTAIVALLVEHGGFPPDWRPYAELASFSYHFGFHALAAGVALVARMAPHEAVILVGQALMVFGVLTAYAFGAAVAGRSWVGVGTALAAAGLSTMPAYYLNWGRYTQLAGQVILPVAAALLVLAAGRWLVDPLRAHEAPSWTRLSLVAIVAVAGLALTHYIVVLFLVVFAAAWVLVAPSANPSDAAALARHDGPRAGRRYSAAGAAARRAGPVVTLGVVALGASLLAAPWIPHFTDGPIGGYAVSLSTTPPSDPAVWGLTATAVRHSFDPVWGQLGELAGWPLVAAFAAGAAVALVRRDRAILVSVLWTALLVASTHPGLLGLPITGLLKPFTVAIGLYLFAGLAVGGAVAAVAGERLPSDPSVAAAHPHEGRRSGARPAVAALLVVACAMGAAVLQRSVLIPQTRLVGPDDHAALGWVAANASPEAVFLVSAFPAFGDTVAAGDDAGWWLTYLTGRAATLPPISYSTERPLEPGYRERVNELVRLWHEDIDAPATLAALDAAAVSHAYVGQVARENDEAGTGQGLAERLAASAHWRLLHEAGQAQVWERTVVLRQHEGSR